MRGMSRFRNSFSKGDRVETPLGVGEIITDIGFVGECRVRLDEALKGDSLDGDVVGDREITANTFQMKHQENA
jgi:hypothetical protein